MKRIIIQFHTEKEGQWIPNILLDSKIILFLVVHFYNSNNAIKMSLKAVILKPYIEPSKMTLQKLFYSKVVGEPSSGLYLIKKF